MRLGGHTFLSARSCTPEWRKRCSPSKKSSTLVRAASLNCSEGTSVGPLFRFVACCWSAALFLGSELSTFKGVYSPSTAVNPISVIAIRGSPNFTLGAGDKTGVSFPTGGSLKRTWTGGSESGICRRGVELILVGNSDFGFRSLGRPEFGIPLPSSGTPNFPAETQIGKPENPSSRESEFRFLFFRHSGIPFITYIGTQYYC